MEKLLLGPAAALAALAPAAAQAGVTFIDAYVAVTSSAEAGGFHQSNHYRDDAFGSFPTLGLFAQQSAGASSGAAFADSHSTASAQFIDPANGAFSFDPRNARAISSADDASAYAFVSGVAEYRFRIGTASDFVLDYSTSGETDVSGAAAAALGYYDLILEGPTNVSEQLFADGADILTFGLAAGEYRLMITQGSVAALPFVEASGTGTASLYQYGVFDFSIASAAAPVPEPATWLTMIVGFAWIGGAMRLARPKRAPALGC